MKHAIVLFIFLNTATIYSQVPKNKAAFIACWEFKEFANTKTLKRVIVKNELDYSIWFINDSLYQTAYRYGTWEYNRDFKRIYLFKKKFTPHDIEKANHYQLAPEIVSRTELGNIILRGNSFYFIVHIAQEPYIVYARCERVVCK